MQENSERRKENIFHSLSSLKNLSMQFSPKDFSNAMGQSTGNFAKKQQYVQRTADSQLENYVRGSKYSEKKLFNAQSPRL